jgi:hypothetical protein
MVEERARRGFDSMTVPKPPYAQQIQRLDRALRLAVRGAEGREIVPPDQIRAAWSIASAWSTTGTRHARPASSASGARLFSIL